MASFGIGGTIVLIVFWNLMANLHLLTAGYTFDYVLGFALQNGILSFIGFLLIGIGLQSVIKSTNIAKLIYKVDG